MAGRVLRSGLMAGVLAAGSLAVGVPGVAADSYQSAGLTGHFASSGESTRALWTGVGAPGWGLSYLVQLGLGDTGKPGNPDPSYALWWTCGGHRFPSLAGQQNTRMGFYGASIQGDLASTVAGGFTSEVLCTLQLYSDSLVVDIWSDIVIATLGAGGFQPPFPTSPPNTPLPSEGPSASPSGSPSPSPSASATPSATPCTVPMPSGYLGPPAPCATPSPEPPPSISCTTRDGTHPPGVTDPASCYSVEAMPLARNHPYTAVVTASDNGNGGNAFGLGFDTSVPGNAGTGEFCSIGLVGGGTGTIRTCTFTTSADLDVWLHVGGYNWTGPGSTVFTATVYDGAPASPSPGASSSPGPLMCFYADRQVYVPFVGYVTIPGGPRPCGPGEADGTHGSPPSGGVPGPVPGECPPGDTLCGLAGLPGAIGAAIAGALQGAFDGLAAGIGMVVVGDMSGTGTAINQLNVDLHGKVDPFMSGLANAGAGFGSGTAAGGADGGLAFSMPWYSAEGMQSENVTIPTLSNPYRGALVALLGLLFAVALVKLAGRIFGVGGDSG